jgi:hypothetical protein
MQPADRSSTTIPDWKGDFQVAHLRKTETFGGSATVAPSQCTNLGDLEVAASSQSN